MGKRDDDLEARLEEAREKLREAASRLFENPLVRKKAFEQERLRMIGLIQHGVFGLDEMLGLYYAHGDPQERIVAGEAMDIWAKYEAAARMVQDSTEGGDL